MEELQEGPNNKPPTSPDRPKTESDPTTQESKSRFQVWLREKRGLLLKTSAAVIPAAVLALAIIRGCDETKSPTDTTPTPTQPTATKTITPTPTPTQVVEITPTPIEASPTPQVETPTPAPTQEVTPAPETEKPKNYTIEILPPTNPDHPASEHYKPQEAQEIVEEILSKYPPLAHIKIQIILGGGNQFLSTESILQIDRASPNIKTSFIHELCHSWDEVIDANPQLSAKKASLLSDPQLGRHYPQVEALLKNNFNSAFDKYYDKNAILTPEELQDLSSDQADRYWIHSDNFDNVSRYFTEQSLASKTGTFEGLTQFLSDPQIQSTISQNKYWQYTADILNKDIHKWEKDIPTIHPDLAANHEAQTYIKAFIKTGRLIIFDKIMSNDPEMLQLFTQGEIDTNLSYLKARQEQADYELFAGELAYWIVLKEEGRISGQNTAIEDMFTAIQNTAPTN